MFDNDSSTYISIDISSHQRRSLKDLNELCEKITDTPANGINFALYRTNHLTSAIHRPEKADYLKNREISKETFRDFVERYSSSGFEVTATVYDPELLQWYAEELDSPYVCIDAGDITFSRLQKTANDHGLPVILDVKASTVETIQQALDRFESDESLLLLHETYPDDTQLQGYQALQKHFDATGGISDLSKNTRLLLEARKHGAEFFKIHVGTEENKMDRIEKTIHDLKNTIPEDIDSEMTEDFPELDDRDREFQHENRRSLMADCSLSVGELLSVDMLREMRPGEGLPADEIDNCLGMPIQRPTDPQEMITY